MVLKHQEKDQNLSFQVYLKKILTFISISKISQEIDKIDKCQNVYLAFINNDIEYIKNNSLYLFEVLNTNPNVNMVQENIQNMMNETEKIYYQIDII